MVRKTRLAVLMGLYGMATMLAAPVALAEQGDWLIRGGVTYVDPKSDNLSVDSGEGGVLTLNVDGQASFGFNVTYMMTDNLGVELLAAWPFKHDVEASISGVSGSAKIAEVKHLPPTLSLQWHFMPEATFRPYVGAGVNWTIFSSEKIDPALADKISVDDSFGLAVQVGADVAINDTWFVNFDIRWIDIDADAEVTDDIGTESIGTIEIDPMVYSIMIGRKF